MKTIFCILCALLSTELLAQYPPNLTSARTIVTEVLALSLIDGKKDLLIGTALSSFDRKTSFKTRSGISVLNLDLGLVEMKVVRSFTERPLPQTIFLSWKIAREADVFPENRIWGRTQKDYFPRFDALNVNHLVILDKPRFSRSPTNFFEFNGWTNLPADEVLKNLGVLESELNSTNLYSPFMGYGVIPIQGENLRKTDKEWALSMAEVEDYITLNRMVAGGKPFGEPEAVVAMKTDFGRVLVRRYCDLKEKQDPARGREGAKGKE